YQQDVGVNFTFNSALSLTLSSSDLHIYNLAPGTANDSNVINVKVLTNSVGGYTLSASVGNNSTYNTRNLKHSNSNISDVFSSINYTTSPTITSNTDLGTDKWGFSFSLDNGDNWSNYNGLPLYNATTWAVLKQTTSPITNETGDDIKFKIAAKASDTKPSGDYNNVINFTVVASVAPMTLADVYETAGKTQLYGYYQMQDMDSVICDSVEVENSELQVIDTRDNKVYWIAKLADGNCWMTQNLDHDIRTDTDFYTYDNTDIGHTSVDSSATWTAEEGTSAIVGMWNATSVGANILQSYDPGDLCWNVAFDHEHGGVTPEEGLTSCTNVDYHYHIGNYYNWPAAIAKETDDSYNTVAVADNSICPAGWMLPPGGNNTNSKSYAYLVNTLNLSSNNVDGTIYQPPVYFVYGGLWTGSNSTIGNVGAYWTSTNYNSIYAYELGFNENSWMAAGNESIGRYEGLSVRCVAR
ncbi:hypothetical protein IJH24_01890, partial [Candidatus Saccharibacteria bacterium]|nr:hypothetical protein [Candidatus Saccharibacteria bacterium]